MAYGIVKWYSSEKKFGFLTTPDCEGDVFVHAKDVDNPPLIEDQHVNFELHIGPKGPKARNVKVVPQDIETEVDDD